MTKSINVKLDKEILRKFDEKIKELNKDPFSKKITKTSFIKEMIIDLIRSKNGKPS